MAKKTDEPQTWATCKYGEITPQSYEMILLGCVHARHKDYPICYNCANCSDFEQRYKYENDDYKS